TSTGSGLLSGAEGTAESTLKFVDESRNTSLIQWNRDRSSIGSISRPPRNGVCLGQYGSGRVAGAMPPAWGQIAAKNSSIPGFVTRHFPCGSTWWDCTSKMNSPGMLLSCACGHSRSHAFQVFEPYAADV